MSDSEGASITHPIAFRALQGWLMSQPARVRDIPVNTARILLQAQELKKYRCLPTLDRPGETFPEQTQR